MPGFYRKKVEISLLPVTEFEKAPLDDSRRAEDLQEERAGEYR